MNVQSASDRNIQTPSQSFDLVIVQVLNADLVNVPTIPKDACHAISKEPEQQSCFGSSFCQNIHGLGVSLKSPFRCANR
jgi:hypothetical protein